jgi:plastocyanin
VSAVAPRFRVAGRLLLTLAILTSLGGTAPAAEVHRVVMKAVDFAPKQITVRVGDTVEWVNEDIVAHTATARDRSWDVNVLSKRSGRMTMQAPGTVSYFCRYHPNMKGEIVVAP